MPSYLNDFDMTRLHMAGGQDYGPQNNSALDGAAVRAGGLL